MLGRRIRRMKGNLVWCIIADCNLEFACQGSQFGLRGKFVPYSKRITSGWHMTDLETPIGCRDSEVRRAQRYYRRTHLRVNVAENVRNSRLGKPNCPNRAAFIETQVEWSA